MLANHKGEIPFFILLLPFLLGIGLGSYFPVGKSAGLLVSVFACLAVLFFLLNLFYRQLKIYKVQWAGGIMISLLLITFGWLLISNYNELTATNHFSKKHADYLLVKVSNEPNTKNGFTRFTATVEAIVLKEKPSKASGNLLVALKDSGATQLSYGDEILIQAAYQPVDPPFNPAEFNYKNYLANQNIHYQMLLYGHHFAVVSKNAGNPLIAYSLRLRQRMVNKLKAGMHDTTAIAVASTLILGYKADLSNDVLQAYSKTGTIHVLSVSGAHVAIIFGLLNVLLGFLDRYRYGKLIKAIIIITLIWYYSMLSGFSAAVCRAAVMISMVIIGKTFNRRINTLNILAISAFGLLLYDPYFIADVGFQLSYLAVFGLVVFQPIVYKLLDIKNKWIDKLWALCSVSIAAQVITFPLSAFYFHQFPVYFLVSNLLIIIPSAVIMYTGIAYLLLPQITFVSKCLASVLEKFILWMNKALAYIEHAPYASIGKIWINTADYLFLYVFIIGFFYFLFNRKAWPMQLGLLGLLTFFGFSAFKRIHTTDSATITFLNVRTHSGIIFRNGNEAVVMTDLIDTDKTYRYSVQPYLDSCQVDKIKNISLKQDFTSLYLVKSGNLVGFKNKTVLIFDKMIQYKKLFRRLKINYLLVTGNPAAGINNLEKYYIFDSLIADADNFNQLVATLDNIAKKKKCKFAALRRNKAITIVSN